MKTKKFHKSGAHLPVRNLRDTLTYYRDTLGFSEEWTFGDKDGGIRRDDMRLLFGEDPPYTDLINSPANRLNLVWFVDNIDEIYSEFKERGIKIESLLEEYPYAMREFAFLDINGYYIRVAEGTEQKKSNS